MSRSGKKSEKSASRTSKSQSQRSSNHQVDKKSEDSLERDDDVDYSNDFVSESLPSGSMVTSDNMQQSAMALQQKAAEIEESGYTDVFEDVSMGASMSAKPKRAAPTSSKPKKIETVDEEEVQESSF